MTRTVNVQSCTEREDGRFMVIFKDRGGVQVAVSDHPVKVGSDVRVRDGRVV